MSEDEETAKAGVIEIQNVSGLTWSHVLALKPWHFRFLSEMAEKGQPMRFKRIFAVNSSRITYYLWNTFKWIMSKAIVDQVRILPVGDDLSLLFQDIPKNLVPAEIGGSWDCNPDFDLTADELKELDEKVQNYWNKYQIV